MSAPVAASASADANGRSSPDNESVSFIVKNPTDRPGSAPFTLTVSRSTTVLALKQRIEDSYPGSPAVSAQRLIYAGKLLPNSAPLSAVFPPVSEADASASASASEDTATVNSTNKPPYTIHLVVSSPPATTVAQPSTIPPATATTASATATNLPPPPSDTPSNPNANNAPPAPPHDHAAYLAHLATMERLIIHTWQTHRDAATAADNAAAAATAAATASPQAQPVAPDQVTAAQQSLQLAAQLHAQAAHLDAHAAALHAAAHAHARSLANNPTNAPPPNLLDPAQLQQLQQHLFQQQQLQQPPAPGADPMAPPPAVAPPEGGGAAFGMDFQFARIAQGDAAAGADADGQPRVRRFVLHFELNWSLIAKLALLVYLLAQDVSPQRLYMLIAVAGAIYLWQTGHLAFVRRVLATALPNPRQLMDIMFPAAPQQPAPQQAADPVVVQHERDASQQQQQLRQRHQAEAQQTDEQHGEQQPQRPPPRVAHPLGRVAVILSFMYSFIYGFVCSLLPAWNPEPHPRMDELLAPRLPNVAANANEDDGNGNGAQRHEHHD